MKPTCIIIDDEPLARKGIENLVREFGNLELKGSFEDARSATAQLSTGGIDIMFLDIEMPKLSGISYLKSLPKVPQTILTTAYSQYAVQGFDLDICDYLLKPIVFERFAKAVNKAIANLKVNAPVLESSPGYVFIKSEAVFEKIFFNDILFVQALENYVIIQTPEKRLISYLTLKAVEDFLPESLFLRVHKSFLVAVSKIDRIEGNRFSIGNHSVPVSRDNREEIMNKVLKGKLLKR